MEMSRDDYIIKYADLSDEELLDELIYKAKAQQRVIQFGTVSEGRAVTSQIAALREVILDRMHS